jgi:large subunit ribosomal protein L9
MEVILKEDVDNLGHRGDVVKVAQGYGRNFLLPRKLAIEATAGNKSVIEQMKVSSVRRSAKEKGDAELLLTQLEQTSLEIARKTGDGDHLFGSVTGADIAQALEAKGSRSIAARCIWKSLSKRWVNFSCRFACIAK